ncbi:MAG: single-stranded DNA-binding protein [Candidatus Sericytochromatia bacterium]|nr:single-stranded DNA-binding protein [Candidatus Tanganyikabacteria bacterium]
MLAYAYNPLAYAWEVHEAYIRKFGALGGPGRTLLVGLNPGPWGMGQTGVPFGDPRIVRDWMGLSGTVQAPRDLHPARPVLGLASTRREESGTTLYGWGRERFGTAERFFGKFYIVGHCPLLLFDAEGRNVTPADFRKGTPLFDRLMSHCDGHLAAVVEAVAPARIVGLGRFATDRAERVARRLGYAGEIACLTHPSPQTRGRWGPGGWGALADTALLRYNS